MASITLTLDGMLGAWSTVPRGEWRLTKQHPSSSHVLGLLACCLGIGRDDDMSILNDLSIEVLSNNKDRLLEMRDYHTVQDAVTNDGKPGRNIVGQREYVVNPSYTVKISGHDQIINDIHHAVQFPCWQPYLGRRCCVPSKPLIILDT